MRVAVLLAVLCYASAALAQNVIYSFPLDTDPGWTIEGGWAFGVPTGHGGSSGGPDPTGGYTGENVYGYNLDGDYPNDMAETEWLKTLPLDFTGFHDVQVSFRRWLGVEALCYDQAWLDVFNPINKWVNIWHNPDG
jgi:hypothetical protein